VDEGGGASRTTDPAYGTSTATDVSLREYLVARLNAIEKNTALQFEAMKDAVEAAFENSQRAIDKADIATEKRFEGVNEFRAALSDQATRFVTTETLAALGDKLQASINRNQDDLIALTKRVDLREGQTEGTRVTTGWLVAMAGIAIASIGAFVVLADYLTAG
jgi:hypothetical protein